MAGKESDVKKGLGMGCGIGIGLVLGIVAAVVIIPLIGLSMCGYGASKLSEVTSEARSEYRQTKEAEEKQEEALEQEKKDAYVGKVQLAGINVADAMLGGKGVFGEVKNAGSQTLRKVEITIYCLDKSGNPISEKTYLPIYLSEWSSDESKLLKPGYIEKFGYKD